MRTVSIDMYQTMGIAVVVLLFGSWLKKKVRFLEKFCVPAPVVGGLFYALIMYVLHTYKVVEFTYDDTIKNICMVIFFTSVGFQANIKVLKKGGVALIVFLAIVVGMIFAQNGLSVLIAKGMGMEAKLGLCTGSIPMVGGHGTSGAFGPILEDFGIRGATTICTASATFGLVVGSLMGGPLAERLIKKKNLLKTIEEEDASILMEEEKKHKRRIANYAGATYQLAIAIGLGTLISWLLSKTGMTFPIYIGAMIIAALMRNIGELTGKIPVHMGEINDLGGICLSIFLGIAMITLKLWQLAELALPMFILLLAQTVLMFIVARFIVFNLMGRNYDAAVLAAGTCGFGMGATPNAMANMQVISEKYSPSVKAYILVPIVGSMFADFLNSLIVTFFINWT